MGFEVIIALVLSVYGTILSSVLAILKWNEAKRNIATIITHTYFYEKFEITFVNTGRRPITITDIRMETKLDGGHGHIWLRIPSSEIISNDRDKEPFPLALTDGEHKTFQISGVASEHIYKSNYNVRTVVYDNEGKLYKRLVIRYHNPRQDEYGLLGPSVKKRSIRRMYDKLLKRVKINEKIIL
jgi:hypothetical protein